MTTASTTTRRVFTGAVMFLFTIVMGASAAVADTPVSEDWPAGDSRSMLDTLLLFGGGTVALIVLVTLFGLLTARNNYVPPPPSQELATIPDGDVAVH